MRFRLPRLLINSLAMAFVALILSGVLPVASWLQSPLVISHAPRRVDAIVILGGGILDAATLTAGTAHRLLYGLRLFKQGYAPVIILTGGNPEDPAAPESQAMANATIELGISSTALIIERRAATTAAQAEAAVTVARARGIESIMLVTSGPHSYRADRAFRKAGLEVVSVPVVGAGRGIFHLARWIELRPHGILSRIGALSPVLYEYGAIGLYWWRGWI